MSDQGETLALIFQEAVTAIVRLRAGRQSVVDGESFRRQAREALRAAAQGARDRGYTSDDIRIAMFAVVAFLDESVLNSRNPLLADWARKPLQEELFGIHMAGEVFFQNVQELLGREESAVLADILEVYCLCVLLGYAGRYTGGQRGELNSILAAIRAKIRRIRGESHGLSPSWAPPAQGVAPARDRWARRLMITAAVCAGLTLVLFGVYSVTLGSPVSQVQELAAGGRR